jgi:hypothetical protein
MWFYRQSKKTPTGFHQQVVKHCKIIPICEEIVVGNIQASSARRKNALPANYEYAFWEAPEQGAVCYVYQLKIRMNIGFSAIYAGCF